ncbi:MAG: pseudaminic acid cytidylyltransferase [Saprospiraceae bacterium]|jgi:N-acylneuraminate cytidylyltransferase
MKKVAIITARGGSKRIPKKNIKDFLGKPIIAYSIEAAISSQLFDEIMVSTDDDEIATIAARYGAKVPFIRSSKNADDFATTVDVLLEVIEKYQKVGLEYTYGCCLYPTAPFITSELLNESFDLLNKKGFDTVFPAVRFGNPIQRALKKDKDGKISIMQPKYKLTRSQDLENSYYDSGQFYWFDTKVLTKNKSLWTENTGVIEIDEHKVQDIDNLTDWRLAELKYKLLIEEKT